MAGMKYRKLRIAWSVGWGVLCIALIVLWVRSYWRWDAFISKRSVKTTFGVISVGGRIAFTSVSDPPQFTTQQVTGFRSEPRSEFPDFLPEAVLGFCFVSTEYATVLTLPHWFLTLVEAIAVAVPWLPWRFSLRTLLIAMTVAGIGLGWIVYAQRN
jgi:hypothetical protein